MLNRLVRLLDARGWQVMIEADRDRAVSMALDAYRARRAIEPTPERGRRHRIEHRDWRRHGVRFKSRRDRIANPLTDMPVEHAAASDGLGRAASWLLRGSDAAANGSRSGSRWPADAHPMATLQRGQSRRRRLLDCTAPPQRPRAAIDDDTAAYASYDEQRKGFLKPGMLADLVVLSDGHLLDRAAAAPRRRPGRTTHLRRRVVYPHRAAKTHELSQRQLAALLQHHLHPVLPAVRRPQQRDPRLAGRWRSSTSPFFFQSGRSTIAPGFDSPSSGTAVMPVASISRSAPDVRRSPMSAMLVVTCISRLPFAVRTRRFPTIPMSADERRDAGAVDHGRVRTRT